MAARHRLKRDRERLVFSRLCDNQYRHVGNVVRLGEARLRLFGNDRSRRMARLDEAKRPLGASRFSVAV